MTLTTIFILFLSLSVFGLLLSLYAVYVEQKVRKNKQYRALCDFSKKISCSKIFLSREGHLLGVSNAFLGVFFYTSLIFFLFLKNFHVFFLLTILAVIGSLYLFYLQLVKLRLFCVVCTLIYLINIGLLILLFL